MSCSYNASLTARLKDRFRRFAEDNRGLAAVEFAMIAAPFFFLLFGLLEICMIFIMSSILDHAVSEASRPLRTGQAQKAEINADQFRESVCERLMGILDCDNRLHIDVREIDGFASTPTGSPVDALGNIDPDQFDFQPGGPNDIVAVRIFYEWNLIAPGISMPLRNMSGNKHLMSASVVFRNEPFGN